MARSFLSFALAPATAALLLLAAGSVPALAQSTPVAPVAPTARASANTPKHYPEVEAAVKQLLRDKNIPNCIKEFEKATRMYPELPSAHVLMYQILAQLNQPNVARQQLEEAVKSAPSDPEPFVILGNIALQEGRIAEATMDFSMAKQLLGSYPIAVRKPALEQQTLSGIAQLAERRENWKEAETRLRELLALAPDDLLTHQRLARSLFWQTKATEAYDVLKQAKAIDVATAKKNGTRETFLTPEAILALYYDQYEANVKPPTGNAETWFRRALAKAPDDLATREVVAKWALDKKGDIPFAKAQADAALRIEEKVPGHSSNVGNMLRGLVALWEKDWPNAENYFQKVIYDAPVDFAARNDIAMALVEQDDQTKKNKALQYAEANYRDNKNNADALATLGWVYFKRGEFDQAKLVLEQAVKATGGNVSNADTATYLAHVLYHQDQKWQAKEILEAFLKSGQAFAMKPEAESLYAKVKDTPRPAETSQVVPKVPN